MKKQIKKLQLNRETLILLETDLRKVDGGQPPPETAFTACCTFT